MVAVVLKISFAYQNPNISLNYTKLKLFILDVFHFVFSVNLLTFQNFFLENVLVLWMDVWILIWKLDHCTDTCRLSELVSLDQLSTMVLITNKCRWKFLVFFNRCLNRKILSKTHSFQPCWSMITSFCSKINQMSTTN